MNRFDKIRPGLLSRGAAWAGVLLPLLAMPVPQAARGQLPPDADWVTLETEHFRVTYPEKLEGLARRAGDRAERAWGTLEERFVEGPSEKVDLVLTDHADISNGYSNVFPSNRIVIFAPPPMDGYSLSYMDEWLELVIIHELAHIFHLDLTRGLGSAVRAVFGRLPTRWPSFPGGATPGWTVEGLATYYESALTTAGRVRGSFHEMVVRTAILEDAFPSLNQISGDSPVWPGGQRYYVFGSLFLSHMLEKHGEAAMGRFVEAVADQWVPYRLDSAARKAFGESFTGAWQAWEDSLEDRYETLEADLRQRAPLTRSENLTREGQYALNPAVSPDGEHLAFARYDARSDLQVRISEPDGRSSRELARTNSLANLTWTPGGEVLFSQIEFVDPYRIRGDLYIADLQGRVRRVTEGQRLDHPHTDPGGKTAVAVQEGGGTSRLVLVDLESGEVRPLSGYDPATHWAYPRWSPDGRWIAAARWQPGAYYDLVILDRDGTMIREVTRDRAVDVSPAWSPDGNFLIWSSDRSGIPNLYAVGVDPDTGALGPRRQITNVLGGAAYPSVDPQGRWLYFAGYHHDGWHIQRMAMDPESWFEPAPASLEFGPTPGPGPAWGTVEVADEAYDPFQTLGPTYWSPAFRSGEEAGGREVLDPGFGLSTSGTDLVGRHSYELIGLFSSGPATFNGGASYAYAGLGNPVLTAAMAQTHDADGPFRAPDDGPDRLFVVERERSVGMGATLIRRRSRSQASLGISGSHIWEHRTLLDSDLTESRDYRLSRPDSRLAEIRMAVGFGTARRYPFSISLEDGIGLFIRGRFRRELALADSLRDVSGEDRSYRDLVGQMSLYKSLSLPGFGRHVLALRGSGGVAGGAGADAYHFEVGGTAGGSGPISFLRFGEGLLFPVRGYSQARRYGRYAWSATAEYRFPLWLIDGGPGLIPLHLDWLSGSLFLDSGNAWGPELGFQGFENPRRDPLASAGGELTLRVMPFWYGNVELRTGVAFPLTDTDGDGVRFYVRVGPAF